MSHRSIILHGGEYSGEEDAPISVSVKADLPDDPVARMTLIRKIDRLVEKIYDVENQPDE